MTDRELMQQVLYAMEAIQAYLEVERKGLRIFDEAIEALRARLAQPELKPVAWMFQHEETGLIDCVDNQQVEWGFEKNNPRFKKIAPLYTAPPQREWQGLTDADIDDVQYNVDCRLYRDYARAIEAKLREKNND